MYILKNALKSITRTKSRNILIGIIVAILAISSCVALSITNSATKLIQSYEESYEVEAWLSLNRESMRNDMNKNKKDGNMELGTPKDFMSNIEQLDFNLIEKYGDSEYVKSYYYTIQANLNASNIEKVTMEENNDFGDIQNQGRRSDKNTLESESGDFLVIGYSSLDAMTDFIDGTYKITSGEMFDPDNTNNNCVISEDLADQNEISVGDSIILINPNNEEETYEFIVTGIYFDSSESTEFTMFSNASNQILVSYNSLNNIVENASDEAIIRVQSDARFKLISADVIDKFTEEPSQKGMSEYYTVSTNLSTLESNLKPIYNLSTFATTFLIIILVIGGVILVIINMINIRERKYEIGVLRSIGMKKHKVLLQFVIETFIVTLSAILVGTLIGSTLTVPVANKMLESEIANMQENNDQVNSNFGFDKQNDNGIQNMPGNKLNGMQQGNIKEVFSEDKSSYVDKFNAVIDLKTILELILIGIVLTIVSSSVSMIFISRYSPLKILSSRT